MTLPADLFDLGWAPDFSSVELEGRFTLDDLRALTEFMATRMWDVASSRTPVPDGLEIDIPAPEDQAARDECADMTAFLKQRQRKDRKP